MSDIQVFAEAISAIGLPVFLAAAVTALGVRYIPKFLDLWIESRRDMAEAATKSVEVAAKCESALRNTELVMQNCVEVSQRAIGLLDALTQKLIDKG
ncbi:MAG: hypothetical protein LBO63_02545 [Oscillospiraceae bacterium]|jgi:hypothetical protein|nr:hypothetical protein [Oscillospiraceae bacterium]